MGFGVDFGESVGEGGEGAGGGGVAALAAVYGDECAVEVFGLGVDGGDRVLEYSEGLLGVVGGEDVGEGVGSVDGLALGVLAGWVGPFGGESGASGPR